MDKIKIRDLAGLVKNDLKCHVFWHTDVTIQNGYVFKAEWKNDIFDDYSGGIKFSDLKRYKFVWDADIWFMDPCWTDNTMFIVIYKKQ